MFFEHFANSGSIALLAKALLARKTLAISLRAASPVALAMPLLQSSAPFGILLVMGAAGESNLLLMFKFL